MQQLEELPEKYQLIVNAIPMGADTLISKDELVKMSNIPEREFYQVINDLIMRYGIVICTSRENGHSGYYIPETEEERINGIRSVEEQANTMMLRANKVRNGDLTVTHAYKEKYSKTLANIPIQASFKFDFERRTKTK